MLFNHVSQLQTLKKSVSLFRKGNSSLKKEKKKEWKSFPFNCKLVWVPNKMREREEKKKKEKMMMRFKRWKVRIPLIHHVDTSSSLLHLNTCCFIKTNHYIAPNAYSWTGKDAKLFFAKLVFGQQCWHLYFRFECWSCSKFNVWV